MEWTLLKYQFLSLHFRLSFFRLPSIFDQLSLILYISYLERTICPLLLPRHPREESLTRTHSEFIVAAGPLINKQRTSQVVSWHVSEFSECLSLELS